MGSRSLLKTNQADHLESVKSTSGELWLQGFLTSASNPKAIIFFTALFPQFINSQTPFTEQFLILSLTYLIVDGLFLLTYGASARWLAVKMTVKARAWLNRMSGGFLILAAMLLGLKSI